MRKGRERHIRAENRFPSLKREIQTAAFGMHLNIVKGIWNMLIVILLLIILKVC